MSNPTESDMSIRLVMSPGPLEVKVRRKGQGRPIQDGRHDINHSIFGKE